MRPWQQTPLDLGLNPSLTLAQFHAGENRQAVDAVRDCARGCGEPLLYLWGEPGLGKTHLLNGACYEAQAVGCTAAYVPLRQVRGETGRLLDGYDAFDLVCLDDIAEIRECREWELAVFDLFNRLRERNRRLMVSGDRAPGELPIALPDLRSRLTWGLALRLRDLSDADKLAALTARANALGFELPEPVGAFLLTRCPRDLGFLWQLLDRLDKATLAAQRKLTIPFVKSVLAETL